MRRDDEEPRYTLAEWEEIEREEWRRGHREAVERGDVNAPTAKAGGLLVPGALGFDVLADGLTGNMPRR